MNRIQLPNGLRLITVERPDSRSVAVSLGVDVGSRDEPAPQAGLAHFTEHMVFRGSRRYPDEGPSQVLERVGGEINAGTDHESTVYYGEVMAKDAPLLIDVLLDLRREPLFAQRHIDTERETILGELSGVVNDDPVARVTALLSQAMWQGPLGREVAGTPATLRHTTRDDLVGFWNQWYRPDRMVLSVAGNIRAAEVEALVREYTAGWEPAGARPVRPQARKSRTPQREERATVSHAHLCLAVYGLPYQHPKIRGLELLASILGDGMGAVLVRRLREEKGLVYRIPVYHQSFDDTGAFVINTSAEAANLPTIIAEITEAVRRLAQEVPDEELHRARELVVGNFLRGIDVNGAIAGWYCDVEMEHDFRTPEAEVEHLYQVTPDQVREMAAMVAGQPWHRAIIRPE